MGSTGLRGHGRRDCHRLGHLHHAAIAGDTSQDLKTGFLLGATPKKQQYGELIGVCVSAVAIGAILYLLNAAWGFGTDELGAPQAMMMKMVVEGVMGRQNAVGRSCSRACSSLW